MRGFTLVELMVTIAIVAMLLLVGLPFARSWIDGTRQLQAVGQLQEAVSQARAMALRNPSGLPATIAGGTVRLELVEADGARTLQVRVRDEDGDWPAQPVWTTGPLPHPDLAFKLTGPAGFPDLATFRADGNAFSCVAFDSHGQRTDADGCALANQERVAIGIGDQALEYAELL
ncbi:pilus assembly FimT family protein [Luteimonas huabeiensis]|uniref:pilus assembly FimT family protein n=1 Tax=Luteimonas huabeiensis TaxID=1244513 RepID=UPI00046461B7|nr:prepilin-type N-terminal cleavage/methylation domain-containing protein [Luteimonas huabeiensis]